MIQIEGVDIPYPNSFTWDEPPIRGKQVSLVGSYSRGSDGSKNLVSLGWNNLTKAEYDLILGFYELQKTNFQTLTFLFENAKMNRDIGPIEVFMNMDTEGRAVGLSRYSLNLTLQER